MYCCIHHCYDVVDFETQAAVIGSYDIRLDAAYANGDKICLNIGGTVCVFEICLAGCDCDSTIIDLSLGTPTFAFYNSLILDKSLLSNFVIVYNDITDTINIFPIKADSRFSIAKADGNVLAPEDCADFTLTENQAPSEAKFVSNLRLAVCLMKFTTDGQLDILLDELIKPVPIIPLDQRCTDFEAYACFDLSLCLRDIVKVFAPRCQDTPWINEDEVCHIVTREGTIFGSPPRDRWNGNVADDFYAMSAAVDECNPENLKIHWDTTQGPLVALNYYDEQRLCCDSYFITSLFIPAFDNENFNVDVSLELLFSDGTTTDLPNHLSSGGVDAQIVHFPFCVRDLYPFCGGAWVRERILEYYPNLALPAPVGTTLIGNAVIDTDAVEINYSTANTTDPYSGICFPLVMEVGKKYEIDVIITTLIGNGVQPGKLYVAVDSPSNFIGSFKDTGLNPPVIYEPAVNSTTLYFVSENKAISINFSEIEIQGFSVDCIERKPTLEQITVTPTADVDGTPVDYAPLIYDVDPNCCGACTFLYKNRNGVYNTLVIDCNKDQSVTTQFVSVRECLCETDFDSGVVSSGIADIDGTCDLVTTIKARIPQSQKEQFIEFLCSTHKYLQCGNCDDKKLIRITGAGGTIELENVNSSTDIEFSYTEEKEVLRG